MEPDSIDHRLAVEVCGWTISVDFFGYDSVYDKDDDLICRVDELDFTKWPHAGLLLEGMGRQSDEVWERFLFALLGYPQGSERTISQTLRQPDLPARIRAAAVEVIGDDEGDKKS